MRDSRLDIMSLVHAVVPQAAEEEMRIPMTLPPLSMPFHSSSCRSSPLSFPSQEGGHHHHVVVEEKPRLLDSGARRCAAVTLSALSAQGEGQDEVQGLGQARRHVVDDEEERRRGSQVDLQQSLSVMHHGQVAGRVGRTRTPSPRGAMYASEPQHYVSSVPVMHTPPSPPSMSTTAGVTATPPSFSRQCAESPSPLGPLMNRSLAPVLQDATTTSCPPDAMASLPPSSTRHMSMPHLPTRSSPISSQFHLQQNQFHPQLHAPCSTSSTSRLAHAPTSPQTVIVKTPRGKRHRCTYVGCGRDFSRLSNLKAHWRRHSGEEPYACMHCTRKFKWRSSLKSHELGCVYEFSKSNNSLRWVYGDGNSHIGAPSPSTVITSATASPPNSQRPRSLPFPHGVV